MHRVHSQRGTAVPSDWTTFRYGAMRSPQLRRALRPLSFILIAGVVGVLLLVATATVPVLFGYHTYIINGGSMEPDLKRGSVAVTVPTSPRALRVGDIIAYHHTPENPPVLHRIIKVTSENGQLSFTTQGDSNQTPDAEPVSLQGPGDKVVYSVPYAGYVLGFAESGTGRLGLIGLPLALLAVLFLRENAPSGKVGKKRSIALDGGHAPAVFAELWTGRPIDPPGAQPPAPTAPLVRLEAEPAVGSPGDHVPAAPPPPAASPFEADRGPGDLPSFLVRQLRSGPAFELPAQPAAGGSTVEPAEPRRLPSPDWPQRRTRRVA